ncbi:LuxR C-terminal-related transcriptional regulator [Streptomyces sp. NPDC092307]|uniref:LuxR C-terminal-related transcriptional regulator n=1 Tax=Streptomyces sp. NPDC092307 TaxID=3366013 RepID=UPI00382517DD
MTGDPGKGRRTVLLADDDLRSRSKLRAILEGSGRYAVVDEACTAAEVTKKLGRFEPELVLMRMSLARELGLRSERLGGGLPRPPRVVLLVGGGQEPLGEALDAGVRGFVSTDLDAALLDAVLDHVLADGCALGPAVLGALMARPPAAGAHFARARDRVALLTTSERHVLALLGYGFENARIAEELHLSQASVKTYVSRLLGKLHLENRTQAALVANETGLVLPGGFRPAG